MQETGSSSSSQNNTQFRKKKEVRLQTIYSRSLLTRNIILPMVSVGKNLIKSFEDYLHDHFEGKCVAEGFIKRNSTKIISYSSGLVQRGTNISFQVVFECDVCFPVEGMLIPCIAKNITKAGIRAESADEKPSPIVVFVARDHNFNNVAFSNIREEDRFTARVIGQRFELNDKYVSIIAQLVETTGLVNVRKEKKRARKIPGKFVKPDDDEDAEEKDI